MAKKKYLVDYESQIGEAISGVDEELFDSCQPSEVLNLTCDCGANFESTKKNLCQRFVRGNNIQCPSCVNIKNIAKRYSEAYPACTCADDCTKYCTGDDCGCKQCKLQALHPPF